MPDRKTVVLHARERQTWHLVHFQLFLVEGNWGNGIGSFRPYYRVDVLMIVRGVQYDIVSLTPLSRIIPLPFIQLPRFIFLS